MLYIYDIKNINQMKKDMNDYQFCSFSRLLNECDNINNLCEMAYDFLIIDITNLIRDSSLNNLFYERYLTDLLDTSDNIHFSLQSDLLDDFKIKYPMLIDDNKINYNYVVNMNINSTGELLEAVKQNTLYTYENNTTMLNFINQQKVISFSNLINEDNGISLQYNTDKIRDLLVSEEILYVDITSAIRTLKVRDYLALQYEILFRKIMKSKSIFFTIESSFKQYAMEIFPLFFETTKNISEESSEVFDEKQSKTEKKNYNEILDLITSKLIGHEEFKKDFRRNFLKFSYLKELKQRKILSILICGESGIGKTEFAKITSESIYPGNPLIKINFGNYSTEGVLNSLIGSPIGYVGSEEGGELINKMIISNSKVILIDEFEKATPSVYNFFYELLEDGKFTDRHGKEHDLEGYIIIFTSNMTEKQYKERIPEPLKSRFDMTYNFKVLTVDEKLEYIYSTAEKLISDLNSKYHVDLNLDYLSSDLKKLVVNNNLRNIKRQIEDIIFNEFFQKQ